MIVSLREFHQTGYLHGECDSAIVRRESVRTTRGPLATPALLGDGARTHMQ